MMKRKIKREIKKEIKKALHNYYYVVKIIEKLR